MQMRKILDIFIIAGFLLFSISIVKAEQSIEKTLDTLVLQLKWKHQFQFAGYYAAMEKGYYKNAGLYVKIIEANTGNEVIPSVIDGRAQFGVATSDLLLVRNSGFPVVLLANIFQHSPQVFLTLKNDGGDNIHDISGKSIMLEDHADELLAYLKSEQIDTESITFLPHTYSAEDLLSEKVFAISAYTTDEPYILMEKGVEFNIYNPRSSGIDFYGDVLFTSEEEINKNPERVKVFLNASLEGWNYALNNSDEIVDIILNKYSKRHSKQHLLYEAEQTKRLIMPEVIEIGYVNQNRWNRIGEIYSELNMLPKSFKVDGFFYNRDQKPDLTSYYLTILGILVITFIILFVAIRFFTLNRKLKTESEEKQIREQELIVMEQRYRNLLKYAPLPIFITSIETGSIIYMNREASEKFEINEDFALKKQATTLYVNPDDRKIIIDKIKSQGFVKDSEVLMRSAGGNEFWAIVTTNTIMYDNKEALFSAVLDISERKILVEELQSANAHKDKLFSIISHDLKGPIGTLNSFLELIVREGDNVSEEQKSSMFSNLMKSSKTTYELLENLLIWSLKQKNQLVFRPRNGILSELVEKNIQIAASIIENKKLNIVKEISFTEAIPFDEDMINTVIRNLLNNAIKFSYPNSEIHISVVRTNENVKFSITDSGTGMTEKTMDSLFNWDDNINSITGTAGEKGTGLGLILCNDLIIAHNGKMIIESELGKGSSFSFIIPMKTK